MWDCLDAEYVNDRIRNSPLRSLDNSLPFQPLNFFLQPPELPPDLTENLTKVDITYIRDSLALICNEVSSPPFPHHIPLQDIIKLIRVELDQMELGGESYIEGILINMQERIREYDYMTKDKQNADN
jgi:hypothetical protein